MMHYRALISVPIEASSDDEAVQAADAHAMSLLHAGGAVAGHTEFVGEVREGLMEMARVVHADPLFLSQLSADWKP